MPAGTEVDHAFWRLVMTIKDDVGGADAPAMDRRELRTARAGAAVGAVVAAALTALAASRGWPLWAVAATGLYGLPAAMLVGMAVATRVLRRRHPGSGAAQLTIDLTDGGGPTTSPLPRQ